MTHFFALMLWVAALLALVAGYHLFDALQAVTVNALRGYKRAVVPLVINVVGLWTLGLGGGYLLALTDITALSGLGIATPLGVRGFWIGAIAGMAVATGSVIVYFLFVAARPQPGKPTIALGRLARRP
jgi:MATE family multidrug resistance protein